MSWKIFCISMTVASVLAFGLHALSGLNFWISLVMVVCGMLLNGYIAMIEEDWPGGFNNPEPEISKTQQRVATATERFLRALIYPRSKKRPSYLHRTNSSTIVGLHNFIFATSILPFGRITPIRGCAQEPRVGFGFYSAAAQLSDRRQSPLGKLSALLRQSVQRPDDQQPTHICTHRTQFGREALSKFLIVMVRPA
jgi:hypothetical protein